MALVEVEDGVWLNPAMVVAVQRWVVDLDQCKVHLSTGVVLKVHSSAEACVEALTGGAVE